MFHVLSQDQRKLKSFLCACYKALEREEHLFLTAPASVNFIDLPINIVTVSSVFRYFKTETVT